MTFGSRALKAQMTGATPGAVVMASSPSYVLQSHPLRENFCSTPARSPSE